MMRRYTDRHRAGRRLACALALAALALTAAACLENDAVEPVFVPPVGGELFTRYVSLGNSITAGFQSDGINDSLQVRAYPVLLAERAGATFGIPTINRPGCPPPLAAPLSPQRVGGPNAPECNFRSLQVPPLVQNLAVPGADMVTAGLPGGNFLNTLVLGGRTQVQAMVEAQPSLVSVWLGSGDILNAALAGDTLLLSPVAEFQAALDEIVDAINRTAAMDAILIGAVNAMVISPAVQPGAFFWVVAESGQSPIPLSVDDNCTPGTPGGSRLVSLPAVIGPLLAGAAAVVTVNCAAEAPGLLNQAEMGSIGTRVATFNAAIEAAAEENGWIYIDPVSDLYPLGLADPNLVRKCQGLATASSEQEVIAAVVNTCPNPAAPNFFGAYFSFDGVHPSSAGHEAIADILAARLNEKHGLGLGLAD